MTPFYRCDDHGKIFLFTRRNSNIALKISIFKFNYTKNIYFSDFFAASPDGCV